MLTRLRQRLCSHNLENRIDEEIVGVTLGWTARPEVLRRFSRRCTKCGWVRIKEGYLPRSVETSKRDTDDWPLTASGERMKIAE